MGNSYVVIVNFLLLYELLLTFKFNFSHIMVTRRFFYFPHIQSSLNHISTIPMSFAFGITTHGMSNCTKYYTVDILDTDQHLRKIHSLHLLISMCGNKLQNLSVSCESKYI